MASTAADRQLEKQAVRKRVKEALRGMSEEQMARESRWWPVQGPAPACSCRALLLSHWHRAAASRLVRSHPPAAAAAHAGPAPPRILSPGAAVAERMLSFDFLRRSQRLAVYIHCERLREVDSSAVVDAALQQGTR